MHLKGYSEIEGVQLVAVADVDEEKAKRQALAYKTKWYADYREMLEVERPDVVSICTPPFLHKEMVIEASNRGIHILCEKPLAPTTADSKEILNSLSGKGLLLMTGFRHRFIPENIQAKEMIKEGKLGRILMYRNRFSYTANREGSWASDKAKSGGGALMDHNVHSADLFRWLIGEVKEVSAQVNTLIQNVEVEESGIMLLRADNDAIGVIEGSWTTPDMNNTLEIYGSEGTTIFNYDKEGLRYWPKGADWVRVDPSKYSGLFESEFEHFVKCIRTGEKPRVDGLDGFKAVEIIEKAYRSIEDRRAKI